MSLGTSPFLALPQIEANSAIASVGLWTGCKFPQCVNLGPGHWQEPRLACLPASGGGGGGGRQRRHRLEALWSLPALAPQAIMESWLYLCKGSQEGDIGLEWGLEGRVRTSTARARGLFTHHLASID